MGCLGDPCPRCALTCLPRGDKAQCAVGMGLADLVQVLGSLLLFLEPYKGGPYLACACRSQGKEQMEFAASSR